MEKTSAFIIIGSLMALLAISGCVTPASFTGYAIGYTSDCGWDGYAFSCGRSVPLSTNGGPDTWFYAQRGGWTASTGESGGTPNYLQGIPEGLDMSIGACRIGGLEGTITYGSRGELGCAFTGGAESETILTFDFTPPTSQDPEIGNPVNPPSIPSEGEAPVTGQAVQGGKTILDMLFEWLQGLIDGLMGR